jgi:hypothetical protein
MAFLYRYMTKQHGPIYMFKDVKNPPFKNVMVKIEDEDPKVTNKNVGAIKNYIETALSLGLEEENAPAKKEEVKEKDKSEKEVKEKVAYVTAHLDEIASALETQYPHVAFALDKISDRMEREAGIVDVIKSIPGVAKAALPILAFILGMVPSLAQANPGKVKDMAGDLIQEPKKFVEVNIKGTPAHSPQLAKALAELEKITIRKV